MASDTYDSLTSAQRCFVLAYLFLFPDDAVEAARFAKYRNPGVTGMRLLELPNIRAALETYRAMYGMECGEIVQLLTEIAHFDPGECIANPPTPEQPIDLEKARKLHALRFLRKISWTAKGLPILEFEDRVAALGLLAKIQGSFNEKSNGDIEYPPEDDALENKLRALAAHIRGVASESERERTSMVSGESHQG